MSKLIQSLVFLSLISSASTMEDYFGAPQNYNTINTNNNYNPNNNMFNLINTGNNNSNNNIYNANNDLCNTCNNLQTPEFLKQIVTRFSDGIEKAGLSAEKVNTFNNTLTYEIYNKIFNTMNFNEFVNKIISNVEISIHDEKFDCIRKLLSMVLGANLIRPNNEFLSRDIVNNNSAGPFGVFYQSNNMFLQNNNVSIYSKLADTLKNQLGEIKHINTEPICGIKDLHNYNEVNMISDAINNMYLKNKHSSPQPFPYNNDDVTLLNNILRPAYNYLIIQAVNNFVADYLYNPTNYTVTFNIPKKGLLRNTEGHKLRIRVQCNKGDNKNLLVCTIDLDRGLFSITAFYNNTNDNNNSNNNLKRTNSGLFKKGLFDFD